MGLEVVLENVMQNSYSVCIRRDKVKNTEEKQYSENIVKKTTCSGTIS